MADQDETGQSAETTDGTPTGEEKETKSAIEPSVEKTGEEPDSEATPEGEPAKPSVDDIPLETFLEREDVKRYVQSVSDKATARSETRSVELAKKRETEARSSADLAERKKLVENEEFDELGRRDAAKLEAEERLLESLEVAGGVISQVTAKRYAEELGEETVERIVKENNDRGGTIVDMTTALAEEATKRAVLNATGTAVDDAEKRFEEKLEARLAEAGLQKREEATKETGPVEKVSGAPASTPDSDEAETYESMSEKYGRGEASWDELLPYKKEHDAERLKN